MDKETYTDEDLIQKTLDDKEVFRFIIERYESKLRRYVKRISSVSEQDCDDVLQDIFIKVYKNLRGYDESVASVSSWIYRIAHNTTISLFRKKKARPEDLVIDDDSGFAERIAADDDVVEEAEINEKITEVTGAIKELPDTYRDFIILFYIEEKSYKEISDILLVPMGTVATKMNRAKKKMKEILYTNNTDI